MNKFDFHTHITVEEADIAESTKHFLEMLSRNRLSGICIHAIEYASGIFYPDCNEKAMAICRQLPNSYAFAGLRHDRDFVEQTKEYRKQGFHGVKLLEGKPSQYRHYGYGYDHPRFEPFFAYAEENQIPLLIHNNDPLANWDITKVSQSAFQKGWYYDETMPSQEHFFKVLEDVFDRHPNLRAAVAHFGFYSNNIPRARALMEKCPNLMMDMTPALIIFDELSQTPEETKAFIEKYHDRMIFGTDVSNRIVGTVRSLNDRKMAVMKHFYEGDGWKTVDGHEIYGMNLSNEVLENIYYRNAMGFMGVKEHI